MASHIELSGTLRVARAPADAFRFFTPEGERLWVPDWDPEYLHPADGALVAGLTFRTRHGGEQTVWLMSRCDVASGAIEYMRITPDSRIGTVAVRLTASGAAGTEATVAYRLTSLSAAGDTALKTFAAGFDGMLADWERSIGAIASQRGLTGNVEK